MTADITFEYNVPVFAGAPDEGMEPVHRDTPRYEALDWETTKRGITQAEALGFDAAWAPDHLMLGRDSAEYECWTLLSAIAGFTDDINVGPPEDFTNFVNAVIDERAFNKITSYIEDAREDEDAEIIYGGDYDDSTGYFIEPTIIRATAPEQTTMREEIFGPVTTVYVYPDEDFASTLSLVDETSPYALTGSIFAKDRSAVKLASDALEQAAGNFYINDKPTGSIVGQQPFGGARRSGTNDKAGSPFNLIQWVSPRAIKETFSPATHFGYEWNQPDAADEPSMRREGSGDGAVTPFDHS